MNATTYIPPSRSFTEAITNCLSKYATFKGWASRSEYWWFFLFTMFLGWIAEIAGGATGGVGGANANSGLVAIALALPSVAVGARRLHDTNRSGWWQLIVVTVIGILLLCYWLAQPGRPAENKYDHVAYEGSETKTT